MMVLEILDLRFRGQPFFEFVGLCIPCCLKTLHVCLIASVMIYRDAVNETAVLKALDKYLHWAIILVHWSDTHTDVLLFLALVSLIRSKPFKEPQYRFSCGRMSPIATLSKL